MFVQTDICLHFHWKPTVTRLSPLVPQTTAFPTETWAVDRWSIPHDECWHSQRSEKKNPVISSPHLGFFFSVLQFLSSFWWLSSVIRYTGSSVKLTVTLKAVSPSVYLYKSLLFPQVSPLVWMKDYVPFVLWLLLCYKLSQLPWSVNRKGATMNSSLGLWQTSTLCAVQIIRKNFRNIFINIILLHWLPGLRNET